MVTIRFNALDFHCELKFETTDESVRNSSDESRDWIGDSSNHAHAINLVVLIT